MLIIDASGSWLSGPILDFINFPLSVAAHFNINGKCALFP